MRKPDFHLKLDLKRWEILLIAFSFLLSGGSFVIFVTGYPVRNLLLNLDGAGTKARIGEVSNTSGSLRRQIQGETEFTSLVSSDALYSQDLVTTGSSANAVLKLDDGSSIELGPNTMVRLATESNLALDGISRKTQIEVVTGAVTPKVAPDSKSQVVIRARNKVITVSAKTQEATRTIRVSNEAPEAPPSRPQTTTKVEPTRVEPTPTQTLPQTAIVPPPAIPPRSSVTLFPVVAASSSPSPSPSPSPSVLAQASPSPEPSPSPLPSPSPSASPTWAVALIEPRNLTRITLDPGAKTYEKQVTFRWRASRPNLKAMFIVKKAEDGQARIVHKELIQVGKNREAVVNWTITSPGNYEWEIQKPDRARFELRTKPKVSKFSLSEDHEAIELTRPTIAVSREKPDTFGVVFKWSAVEGAARYLLSVFKSEPGGVGKDPLARTVANENRFVLGNTVFPGTGKYRFQVDTVTSSGFRIHSQPLDFELNLDSPRPMLPRDRVTVSMRALKKWRKAPKKLSKKVQDLEVKDLEVKDEGSSEFERTILLTWQAPSRSPEFIPRQTYEIQVASDANFDDLLHEEKPGENFVLYHPGKPGVYYWRVRAVFGNFLGPWCTPRMFTLTP